MNYTKLNGAWVLGEMQEEIDDNGYAVVYIVWCFDGPERDGLYKVFEITGDSLEAKEYSGSEASIPLDSIIEMMKG